MSAKADAIASLLVDAQVEQAMKEWKTTDDRKAYLRSVGAGEARTQFIVDSEGHRYPVKPILRRALFLEHGDRWSSLVQDRIADRGGSGKVGLPDYSEAARQIGLRVPTEPSKANSDSEARRSSWVRTLDRDTKFRKRVYKLYDGRCAVSECSVECVLEAAHLDPVSESPDDSPRNGILLRVDLHRLFDAGLMAFEPTRSVVHFSKSLREPYSDWNGRIISLPSNGPDWSAFGKRWHQFKKSHE